MTKLVILDRDGVINYDSEHYIKSVEEFNLIPGSVESIAKLTDAGFRVAIATNQSGISRKLYSHTELSSIHAFLIENVQAAGGKIDAIEYCPHLPDTGCICRKPKPGMLLAIAERFAVDLQGVPFVGDRITDIQAAEAVGAKPLLVLSSMTDMHELENYPHVPTYPSLKECVDMLVAG